jgi:hypothetical protein
MSGPTPGAILIWLSHSRDHWAMRRRLASLAIASAALGLAACGGDDDGKSDSPADRLPRFSQPRQIDNPYLPLTEFTRCELRGAEDRTPIRVVRRLLPRGERFSVGGRTVETAVIEDRAFEDGELVERTLDYFGQADDGTVYYFGEDVDDYRDGRVVGHKGAWRYGRETRTLGVAMPPQPRPGDRWRFEDVPGITIESDEVVERLDRLRVGRTEYRDVIRVRERLQPEGDTEHKLYARGTGVIRELPPDGRVDLVGCR